MSVLDFTVKTAELEDNAFIVTVTGEADLHTTPELDRALQGVLALGASAVAVDLAGVSFIDSTALGVLLRFHERFEARGGRLVIVTDDRRLRRMLEISGLDRIFTVERRLADAVGDLL
jgi:anti-sigma B factor antagonist